MCSIYFFFLGGGYLIIISLSNDWFNKISRFLRRGSAKPWSLEPFPTSIRQRGTFGAGEHHKAAKARFFYFWIDFVYGSKRKPLGTTGTVAGSIFPFTSRVF